MDLERDPRLHAALRHAPDDTPAVPRHVRAAILQAAHDAVAPRRRAWLLPWSSAMAGLAAAFLFGIVWLPGDGGREAGEQAVAARQEAAADRAAAGPNGRSDAPGPPSARLARRAVPDAGERAKDGSDARPADGRRREAPVIADARPSPPALRQPPAPGAAVGAPPPAPGAAVGAPPPVPGAADSAPPPLTYADAPAAEPRAQAPATETPADAAADSHAGKAAALPTLRALLRDTGDPRWQWRAPGSIDVRPVDAAAREWLAQLDRTAAGRWEPWPGPLPADTSLQWLHGGELRARTWLLADGVLWQETTGGAWHAPLGADARRTLGPLR